MWVKTLVYPWEWLAKSLKLFNLSDWCYDVEKLHIWICLLQHQFVLLNSHMFMVGYPYHICATILILGLLPCGTCNFMICPYCFWGVRLPSLHIFMSSPLCAMDMACVPVLGLLWERVGGGLDCWCVFGHSRCLTLCYCWFFRLLGLYFLDMVTLHFFSFP